MCYPRTLGEAESVRLGRWVGFRQENKGGLFGDLSVAQMLQGSLLGPVKGTVAPGNLRTWLTSY